VLGHLHRKTPVVSQASGSLSWRSREKRSDKGVRWTEKSRGIYGVFRERLRTIFFVLPSQLPTTLSPCRSPLAMMINA